MQNLEPYFSETPGFFTVILIHSAYIYPVLKCFSMPPVWFSLIAPELLCKSYMITTSLYALHYISGFFIIMSPAEGLHFSALVGSVVPLPSRPAALGPKSLLSQYIQCGTRACVTTIT